jgi:hypothetical protein
VRKNVASTARIPTSHVVALFTTVGRSLTASAGLTAEGSGTEAAVAAFAPAVTRTTAAPSPVNAVRQRAAAER